MGVGATVAEGDGQIRERSSGGHVVPDGRQPDDQSESFILRHFEGKHDGHCSWQRSSKAYYIRSTTEISLWHKPTEEPSREQRAVVIRWMIEGGGRSRYPLKRLHDKGYLLGVFTILRMRVAFCQPSFDHVVDVRPRLTRLRRRQP